MTNLRPIKTIPVKYIKPDKPKIYGNNVMQKRSIEYKNICNLAKSLPCVTGNIGISAFL